MNDFEEFNVTPELTLDPFQEEKKETPQIYQEQNRKHRRSS